MTKDVDYPLTPEEWQKWIDAHLEISVDDGCELTKENRFPFDRLTGLWHREFGVERGYSPSFIPALTRNKIGFLRWVYSGGSEPNWTKSD